MKFARFVLVGRTLKSVYTTCHKMLVMAVSAHLLYPVAFERNDELVHILS